MCQNIVSTFGRVTGDISEGPNTVSKDQLCIALYHGKRLVREDIRLFTDIQDTGRKEVNKEGDRACTDDHLSMVRSSRCDVCGSQFRI